jgi:glycosyltransferase involved in cell wall biosynthesis
MGGNGAKNGLSNSSHMNVLALASYPIEAAATRYRLAQFVAPLTEHNIQLTIHPLIDSELFAQLYAPGALPSKAAKLLRSTLARLLDVVQATRADVILVQREAAIFGPPLLEWFMARLLRRPMVLDLDDATYVPYTSPTYGRFTKALKFFGKTDYLIRWSRTVVCGNQTIAEYVSSRGGHTEIIPTVVDLEKFRPRESHSESVPVVGWVGSHSTFPFLESILPALSELAKSHSFKLKIVGSGKAEVSVAGVEVENLEWNLEREIEDFRSIDIGLYPLSADNNWTLGKSGFKAIQWMAVGVPYVVTPIGAAAQIGEPNVTHYFADTQDEWIAKLKLLLTDSDKRRAMGAAGRQHALAHFGVAAQADKLARVLRDARNRE